LILFTSPRISISSFPSASTIERVFSSAVLLIALSLILERVVDYTSRREWTYLTKVSRVLKSTFSGTRAGVLTADLISIK
jgi:hypothetical protein